jgi:hypothetical protein
MLHLTSLVAIAVSILSLVSATPGDKKAGGYIYDGVDKADKLSIVIDVAKHNARIESTAHASIGSAHSEIIPDYEDCGNQSFYCITGMLEIVIPKAMPIKHWKHHGLSCKSVSHALDDTYRITCWSPQYRGRPTYTYSLSRGIVSIESSPIGGDYKYELRGDHGLFSVEK